jgi:hypothetical protein
MSPPDVTDAQLLRALENAARDPDAWPDHGQCWHTEWMTAELGLSDDHYKAIRHRLPKSCPGLKAEVLMRWGMRLPTELDIRAWYREHYFELGYCYQELADRIAALTGVPLSLTTLYQFLHTRLGYPTRQRGGYD